jgi:hypothetical protein
MIVNGRENVKLNKKIVIDYPPVPKIKTRKHLISLNLILKNKILRKRLI